MINYIFGIILLLAALPAALAANRYSDNPFDTNKALRSWWENARRARSELDKRLPRETRSSFDKAAAGYVPLAALSPLTEGDFNCDGKTDYALVTVPVETRLARALSTAKLPSKEKLKAAHADFLNYRYSAPATVWVALSGRENASVSWVSLAGSEVAGVGKVPVSGDVACAKLAPSKEVTWARQNKCDALLVAGREVFLWSPEKKDLLLIGQCK